MRDRTFGGLAACNGRVASTFLTILCATCVGPSRTADAVDSALVERVRQRQEKAQPIGSQEVVAVKNRLIAAVFQLNTYLSRQGKNGLSWKRYLKLDVLAAALQDVEPSDEVLAACLRRLRSDYPGLERAVCTNVASALDHYLRAAGEHGRSTTQAQIEEKLDELAKALEALDGPPTREQLTAVADLLGWFSDRGMESELMTDVHAALSHPNLNVHVSQDLIASGSLRRINNEPRPVRDFILGTTIVGTGRTNGWVRTRLLPDSERGLFEVKITATNTAQTMGYNGPAIISTKSVTPLRGTKRFYLDQTGFHVWQATSCAEAHSQICGIGSSKPGLRGRIVQRVATKRAAQQKGLGEQIASRHAEQQLDARLDTEANAQLGRAHADYLAKIRNPLVRLAQWPREVRMASTLERLRITVLYDSASRFAATISPPDMPEQATMAVQFHESMVNNYGDGLLAGRTLQQADLDRLSLDLFGKRPQQLVSDEEKGPWTMTFAGQEPIRLRVDGGRASFTLRGRRFGSVERMVETPLDITAHYELLRENGAAKGKRLGEDIEVQPTGFVPGKRKMTVREIRDASFVRNRFNDFFTEEITSQGLVLPGQWAQAGRLELVELLADHGWVTLAWRRADDASTGTD
jgi:hypothetical protein